MTDLFDHPAVAPSHGPGVRASVRRRAAVRRKRQRRRRSMLIITAVLVAVGVVAWTMFDDLPAMLPENPFSRSAEDYPGPGSGSLEVEIPEGATGTQMGQVLMDAGVVASVTAFTDAYGQNPAAKGIQSGTYSLRSEMKASDAVAALVKNEKVEMKVTIPEGFTAAQVLERITSVAGISKEDLDAAIADPASIGLPAEAGGNVEGWLFPATYSVTPKDTAVTVLSTMIAKTIGELDAAGVAPQDRLDIIKKASIVEREAPPGFLGEVARVIANRLDRDEPLGMDAVDAYGLGKPAAEITSDEFRDASLPYASRQHKGLPPTPIGNPGAAAIGAAANPPEGPWLWYVTVNLDSGETKFTDNYDEFQTYKKEYQAWEAAQDES